MMHLLCHSAVLLTLAVMVHANPAPDSTEKPEKPAPDSQKKILPDITDDGFCWPRPYRCPPLCYGPCCQKWGCIAIQVPYSAGAKMPKMPKSQWCPPPPYRCPKPCRGYCCSYWGC